mmetsp:Transcript_46747/g.76700  ORF Transcript_46747/g.76700 Transcript_46747/m.76700 type:complete len:124 (-) Transcript_46747:2607-2978(-)
MHKTYLHCHPLSTESPVLPGTPMRARTMGGHKTPSPTPALFWRLVNLNADVQELRGTAPSDPLLKRSMFGSQTCGISKTSQPPSQCFSVDMVASGCRRVQDFYRPSTPGVSTCQQMTTAGTVS